MTDRVRAILYPESWWECFICGSHERCQHREHELVAWMHAAPSLAQIAASRPERIAPARQLSASAGQLELFAAADVRRRA